MWKVNKVTRENDDLVALVFESGIIHIDTMKTHLKECSKNGARYVTTLAKVFMLEK